MKATSMIALFFAAALPAAATEIRVEARLEPPVIGIGETATLIFEARTDDENSPRFRPDFEYDNLQIVAGPYRSNDVSFVNGAISRSFRIAFRVRALATGKARVHSIVLEMPGQTVRMGSRSITVQAEPTRRQQPGQDPRFEDPLDRLLNGPFGQMMPRRPPRDPAVLLRSEVTPARPWAGQQLTYTVYLYTRDDISAIMPRELPTFRGFWVREIPLPQNGRPEMVDVDGVRYARFAILQRALFPLRAGRYSIEPATIDVLARVIEPRFFGPPFTHSEQARVSTAPQVVDVQALPAPQPPGFAGPVGRLGLEARLDPPRLHLGEAATLTVKLAGQGNLQGVGEPKITLPEGLTLLPPQQQAEDQIRGTTVTGEHTWSYVVVPEKAGRYTLRVPEIPYFDPASAAYRIAAAPELRIEALPALPASGIAAPRPIHTAALAAAPFSFRGGGSQWAPWLFALPWGIAFAVFLARRRRPAVPCIRLLPAGDCAAVEQRLREAEGETRPRQAAARIEDAWRELLATRWEIPSGTPATRWCEALAARGAEPAIAAELRRLAEELDYLRHAPQLSETGGLVVEAVDRSRRLLRRLR